MAFKSLQIPLKAAVKVLIYVYFLPGHKLTTVKQVEVCAPTELR